MSLDETTVGILLRLSCKTVSCVPCYLHCFNTEPFRIIDTVQSVDQTSFLISAQVSVQRMGSTFELCATCTKMIVAQPVEEAAIEVTLEPVIMYSYARRGPLAQELIEEMAIIEMRNKWLGCNESHL